MPEKLLAYFTLFFLLAFLWPVWRVWRRDKVNALRLPFDDTAEGVVGRYFGLTLLASLLLLAALSLGLPLGSVGPLRWMQSDELQLVGWVLLIAALVWIIVAQWQMGSSWRIGIDSTTRPPLVRNGLFRLSRNPIFLGMRVSLLGLFLVLPNAGTLAILVLGEALIQVQVRLEEVHLRSAFKEQYDAYCSRTRRWL